jgi:hypothetical protein
MTATAPAAGNAAAATTAREESGVPVTPCAPTAAVDFMAARFGPRLADGLDPASRAATTRAARIGELRRCGELRDAERYGWLSLTGWLLDLPATVLGRLDPTGEALGRRAGRGDLLPEPLAPDPDPGAAEVAGTGLFVPDPRDPLGWTVLSLAAAALTAGVVDVGGRRLGGGAAIAALTARLQEAGRG